MGSLDRTQASQQNGSTRMRAQAVDVSTSSPSDHNEHSAPPHITSRPLTLADLHSMPIDDITGAPFSSGPSLTPLARALRWNSNTCWRDRTAGVCAEPCKRGGLRYAHREQRRAHGGMRESGAALQQLVAPQSTTAPCSSPPADPSTPRRKQ